MEPPEFISQKFCLKLCFLELIVLLSTTNLNEIILIHTLKINPKTLKIRQFYISATIKKKCLHFVRIMQALNHCDCFEISLLSKR